MLPLQPGVVHADLAEVRPGVGGAPQAVDVLGTGTEDLASGGARLHIDVDHVCGFHRDQVIVPLDRRAEAMAAVPDLASYVPPEEQEEVAGAVRRLEAGLDLAILTISGPDPDPVAVATELREADIEASPHYLVIPAPSWKFGPGDVAVAAPDPSILDTPQNLFPGADGTVTVIDTGIPRDTSGVVDHGALIANPNAANEAEPANLPPDVVGHGIFIAGIVKDLAPGLTVSLWKAQFSGDRVADELSVVSALDRAADAGPLGVVNLSLGTYACREELVPMALRAALARVSEHDATTAVVAAAGNDGHGPSEPRMYPAAFPGVVAVGAALGDPAVGQWQPAAFSNDAPVWAPGVGILSRYPRNQNSGGLIDMGAAVWSGTSFAAPHYAACVAAGYCQPGAPPTT